MVTNLACPVTKKPQNKQTNKKNPQQQQAILLNEESEKLTKMRKQHTQLTE